MRKIAFLLLFLFAACDSDNAALQPQAQALESHPPVISDLKLTPDSATQMAGDGSIPVTAEFNFSDAGLDVVTMRVEMSDGTSLSINFDQTFDTEIGTISRQIDVCTEEVCVLGVEIWVIDAAGDSSNHLSASVQVTEPTRPPQIANLYRIPWFAWHMQGNGSIPLTIELDYVAYDAEIVAMQIEQSGEPSLTIDFDEPLAIGTGSISETIDMSTEELGNVTIEVWLIDSAGSTSNHLTIDVIVRVYEGEVSEWTPRAEGLSNVLNDVHWNGAGFLAVGDGGTIMRSADGIDWTTADSGTDVNLHAIAWDGSDYAVVGDRGTVLVSGDGHNWTLQYKGSDDIAFRAAVYSGSQLLAAGKHEASADTAVIVSSMDQGQTWAPAAVLPQSGRSITDIARGNAEFVATTTIEDYSGARETRVLTSPDGFNWSEITVNTTHVHLYTILWDGSRYWVGGRVGQIYTSPDGTDWTEIQTPMQAAMFRGIASSGGTLIADGFNEWIGWGPAPDTGVETNDDGNSWRTFVIHRDFDTNGLAWGNGRFVAVGCFGAEQACQGYAEGATGAIYATP